MVVNLDDFKENAEDLLAEALEYDEPVILKTGLGNFILMPESEFQAALAPADTSLEAALFSMK